MKAKKPKGMPYGVVKRMNPEKPEGMPYEVWKYAQDIEDKEWLVRERAAEALKINLESAIPHLIRALRDENWYVRERSGIALFRIAGSLKEKQEKGKKITPEGEKLLKTIALFNTLLASHFREDESGYFKARALHAAYNSKEGEIDESNARLFIKQLRAHEGHLK